jgi:hypothetical protein
MVSGQWVQPTLLHLRRTLRRNGQIFLFQLPQTPPFRNVEASELSHAEIERGIHDSSLWYPFATDAPIFTYLTLSEPTRLLI